MTTAPEQPITHTHRNADGVDVVDSAYDASSIQVLEGLDAVRKRPGMYIGSTGERGLHHLVYEVVDNSVDEALAGYCDTIDVTILPDGGVRVVDNGRGIPVDERRGRGPPCGRGGPHRPARRRQVRRRRLLRLRRAARRRRVRRQRAVAAASTSRSTATVSPETQSYDRSRPVAPLAKGEAVDDTGTTVTFWADPDIFETTDYDFETLSRRFQEMAFLNKGLRLSLRDERPEHEDVSDEAARGRPPPMRRWCSRARPRACAR